MRRKLLAFTLRSTGRMSLRCCGRRRLARRFRRSRWRTACSRQRCSRRGDAQLGKLIALGYIFDGTTEYSPGDSFETTDDEAGRLIALGVAKAEPEAEVLADAPLRDSTNTGGGSADDVVADNSVVQPPTKDLDPDVLALVERV